MEILIRGNKLEVTDSMKSYVKEKLSKLDKYLVDQTAKATVLGLDETYSVDYGQTKDIDLIVMLIFYMIYKKIYLIK